MHIAVLHLLYPSLDGVVKLQWIATMGRATKRVENH